MAEGTRHWDLPDGFMNRLTQQEGKANPSRWRTLYATSYEFKNDDKVLYISEKVAKFINDLYEEWYGDADNLQETHAFISRSDWRKLPKERTTFFYYICALATEKIQEALDVRPEHCFKQKSAARVEIQKNYNIKQAKHKHDIDQKYIQRVYMGYLKWHLK